MACERGRCAWTINWLLATAVMFHAAATPVRGQTRLATFEELRQALNPGDVISVVETSGQSVHGRLVRVGSTDLTISRETQDLAGRRRALQITIPLRAIESIDRPRDSSRNGALIGTAVGAGMTSAMFLGAMVTDRNEMDEWAPIYLGMGTVFTGIGALVGWAIDSAHSKPHIRFVPRSAGARMTILPFVARAGGVRVTISF